MIIRIFKEWLTERRLRKQAMKIFEEGSYTMRKRVRPYHIRKMSSWFPEEVYTIDFVHGRRCLDVHISEVDRGHTFYETAPDVWQRYVRTWMLKPVSILRRIQLETAILEQLYKSLEFDEKFKPEVEKTKDESEINFNQICAEIMHEETSK